MVTYSQFKHDWIEPCYAFRVPMSKDYRVFLNGEEIPVYSCRVSAYPFNTVWPGHQRYLDQTELASYVNIISDQEVTLQVQPLTKTAYEKIMLKPYSKGITPKKVGDKIEFTLKENGGYVLELDDYHGFLYIFNNKPVVLEDPKKVTYYFDKGVHFVGRLQLRSNESVYLDKDALVYGCVYAENAENIHVYGNGVFDDGAEERVCDYNNCFEPFTNGNIKFYDCKNIKLEGVGFANSAIWCVNFFHCENVEIDGIKVFGQWRYNSDGIDIVNTKKVKIKDSFIHSFDDVISLKGIDRYAESDVCDVSVYNCVLWCDWNKVLELGLESVCKEYKNITFKNCDVLRGSLCVCDIQNGDCAEMHDITFEDIRIELESFYTTLVYQMFDQMKYDGYGEIEPTSIFSITNPRYRDEVEVYKDVSSSIFCSNMKKDENYASAHDILVKDICIYADEKVVKERGKGCAKIQFVNKIATTKFRNIVIDNVMLNGKKLSKEDIVIEAENFDLKNLTIK